MYPRVCIAAFDQVFLYSVAQERLVETVKVTFYEASATNLDYIATLIVLNVTIIVSPINAVDTKALIVISMQQYLIANKHPLQQNILS